jgi:hypothetical protein
MCSILPKSAIDNGKIVKLLSAFEYMQSLFVQTRHCGHPRSLLYTHHFYNIRTRILTYMARLKSIEAAYAVRHITQVPVFIPVAL